MLPVALRSILPKYVRLAICWLSFFFNALYRKIVDVSTLDELQSRLVVTLCLLEKYFPPSFFDIMIHLTMHLVREVRLCGLVYFRCMYPFERFMKYQRVMCVIVIFLKDALLIVILQREILSFEVNTCQLWMQLGFLLVQEFTTMLGHLCLEFLS